MLLLLISAIFATTRGITPGEPIIRSSSIVYLTFPSDSVRILLIEQFSRTDLCVEPVRIEGLIVKK